MPNQPAPAPAQPSPPIPQTPPAPSQPASTNKTIWIMAIITIILLGVTGTLGYQYYQQRIGGNKGEIIRLTDEQKIENRAKEAWLQTYGEVPANQFITTSNIMVNNTSAKGYVFLTDSDKQSPTSEKVQFTGQYLKNKWQVDLQP